MRYTKAIILYACLLIFTLIAKNSFADPSDYIIRVNYDGPVTLYEVEVFLYDTDRACNTLVEDPTEPPSEDAALTRIILIPDAEGNIPDRGLNVQNEVVIRYAVARGRPVDSSGGGKDYFVTFGCKDQIPDPVAATLIEIDMHNLLPEVAGTYQIHTEGITLRPIPNEFHSVRNTIDEFLYTPGLGLLRLMAVSLSGDQYWQSYPWNELFNCRGILQEPYADYCKKVSPTKLGKLAGSIIEAHVDENLASFLGVQDASIRDSLAQGEEIIELADSFSLTGALWITQNPDSDGYLGNNNGLAFDALTWKWGGNERTITFVDESVIRGENIEASVRFHPHPDSSEEYSLAMDPLIMLNLNYPKMLFSVLEGIVLPELLGYTIGSFGAFATNLMDCELLSRRLFCEDPYANDPDCNPDAGFAAVGIKTGCEFMQGSNPEPISPLVSSLLAGKDTWYLIHTPPHNPCRMSFVPADNEFKIQILGGDPVDFCEWEGEIVIYPDDVVELINWVWWGECCKE